MDTKPKEEKTKRKDKKKRQKEKTKKTYFFSRVKN